MQKLLEERLPELLPIHILVNNTGGPPGGLLYEAAPHEFIKAFTQVKLDPRWRPRYGFLTPEAWDQALLHAGFTSIRHTPPPRPLMDRHPTFTVGAMTAIV